MPRLRAIASFLFCVGWALSVSAAEPARLSSKYRIDGWQLDEGLPQNSVTTVIQSRSGYLWLGTFNGLVRFDGVNFRVYDSDNTPELGGNRITKLIEGADGSLWIGTDGSGLTHYRNGRFKQIVHPELSQSSITTMCEDRDGGLWIGTLGGGVVRLMKAQATVYGAKEGLPDASIRSLAADRYGRIWVGAAAFLGFFQQDKLTSISVDANAEVQLGPGRSGTVWIAIGDQLQQTDEHAGLKVIGGIPSTKQRNTVTMLYEDRRGDLWLGTYGGGLLRHHRGVFENITTADGLPHDTVLSIVEDKEENLWVGTRGGGLSRLKERVFEVLDTKDRLSEEVVLSVCQGPAGNIWIGTDGGGLNCLSNGQFTVYSQKHGLRHQSILGVYEDRRTNLWVGAAGSGLYQRRGPSSQFIRRFSLSGRHVQAISEDRDGTLWVGTSDGGLNFLRPGPFPRFFTHFTTRDGLSHNDVRVIHPDKAGNLWIGTGGGGLNRFADGKFTTFRKRDGLPSDLVRTIHEDTDGALWIGTAGGLCRLKEGKFTPFTQNHGLPVTVITQIFEDGAGNFWIGSAKGIFRVRKRELDDVALGRRQSVTCVSYDKSDGLGSRECSGNFQPAGWKTADGRLWFPTIKGIAVVDPNNFKVNKRPPQVIIEEVVADGRRNELAGPSMEDRAVQIKPGADQIEFRYTGLSFSAPRRVSFKYRLEGLDKDWVDARTRRSAYYGQLPPGNYRFQVLAANNDGFWNDVGSSLAVMVPTPWWRTWWFTSLAALTLTAAMVGVTRYLTSKQLTRRLELLEHQNAVEKERTRIAQDMHDQLGASLTRVGLLSELIRREASTPAAVVAHTSKISETTQEVVKTLDEIVWTVNPKNDTLDKLADYLVHYAEEFFESTPVRCRLDVPAELPSHPLTADVRHNVFLAFKEALNNILRHAGASEAGVQLVIGNDHLELTVKDNGRGFDASSGDPRGNGLPNLRRRLAEIHGRFELRSAPGQGCVLKFSVPLGR